MGDTGKSSVTFFLKKLAYAAYIRMSPINRTCNEHKQTVVCLWLMMTKHSHQPKLDFDEIYFSTSLYNNNCNDRNENIDTDTDNNNGDNSL